MGTTDRKDRVRSSNPFERKGGGERPSLMALTDSMIDDAPPEVVERVEYVEVVPPHALVPVEDGVIETAGFVMTSTSLQMKDSATFEDWKQVGSSLLNLDRSIQWLLGDWLAYGEDRFGQRLEDIANAVGRDKHTLENYIWVARSVPYSLRKESLYFGHHNLVAGIDSDQEKATWLNDAVRYQWSISQMREAIAKSKRPALSEKEDTFGADNFKDNAQGLAKLVNMASGEGRLKPKQAEEGLSQIEAMRAWLDQAERMIRDKMRS